MVHVRHVVFHTVITNAETQKESEKITKEVKIDDDDGEQEIGMNQLL